DVHHALAGPQADLAADVLDLVALRLLDRLRAFLPVGAGVHHQLAVEPHAVEVGAVAVMEARVRLGLGDRAVGEAQLVPLVARPYQGVRTAVEAAVQPGTACLRQVAVDIDIAVEIRLEQTDVAESQRAPLRAGGLEVEPDDRIAGTALPARTVGEGDVEADLRSASDALHQRLEHAARPPASKLERAK